jgi:pyrimidine operon attenuation protein/uracil phosphoribosyltransferase
LQREHREGTRNDLAGEQRIRYDARWIASAREVRAEALFLPMTAGTPTRLPNLREKGRIMSASEVERTLIRLAHELVEKNNGVENLTLVGIKRRGAPLAERLAKLIEQIEKKPIALGTLDITLYRDDLSTVGASPVIRKSTPLGVEIGGRNVILVDDVLYTGRTIRAAMDALFDHGRPRRVQLCVLIDRGHRELPIEAAFVGRMVQTTEQEIVEVRLAEVDQEEQVMLVERAA